LKKIRNPGGNKEKKGVGPKLTGGKVVHKRLGGVNKIWAGSYLPKPRC